MYVWRIDWNRAAEQVPARGPLEEGSVHVRACCDPRAGEDSSRVRMVRSPQPVGRTVTREEALDMRVRAKGNLCPQYGANFSSAKQAQPEG